MTQSDSVFSSGAVQGYLLLLVACGAGLLFSIPAGAHVADLMNLSWNPSPLVFHLTYVALLGILGTFRGIAAARWDRAVWDRVVRLGMHVLFGQVIVLPYLFFSRALLPGSAWPLVLLAVYATLASYMSSLVALRLERWGAARHAHTFLLQYATFGAVFFVPWAIGLVPRVPSAVALLSPLGAGLRILQSAPAQELLIAFGFVLFVIAVLLPGMRRPMRRSHAV